MLQQPALIFRHFVAPKKTDRGWRRRREFYTSDADADAVRLDGIGREGGRTEEEGIEQISSIRGKNRA